MEFASEFVALRDRIVRSLDSAFEVQRNVPVAGRTAALLGSFGILSERRLLGLMATGKTGHAHEYRLLFAEPELDADGLADWWAYAERVEQELVQPDESHDFSIVSLILVTRSVEPSLQKKVRRLTAERKFAGGKQGWSSIHIAVVALDTHQVYTNRLGGTLKNILQPIV